MYVPLPVLIGIGVLFVCVLVYAIGMYFVARTGSKVIDGIIQAFWR